MPGVTNKPIFWWLVWMVIVLTGFLIALTGYNHGLPYIDFGDEMTLWTMGRAGIDPSWTMFSPQFPPGSRWVSSLVQLLQHAAGEPYINPAGTIQIMRLTSVIGYTVTLGTIMLLARRMIGKVASGWIAGISTGLFWLLLSLAVWQSRHATIDMWVCMWFILAIAAGVEGWHRRSVKWIVLSLALSLIAPTFKWQGGAALALTGLACLVFWREDRRKSLLLVAFYVVVVGLYGFWAVFIHRALEGGVYLPGTEIQPLTFGSIIINVGFPLFSFESGVFFGVLALGGLLLPLFDPAARRRLYDEMPLWAFPFVMIAFSIVISLQGAPVFERHYLSIVALQAVMAGIGIALLVHYLWRIDRIPAVVRLAGIAVLALLIAPPLVAGANNISIFTAEMQLPDRRVAFAEWVHANVTEGGITVVASGLATALDPLYGYSGRSIVTPEWGAYTGREALTDAVLVDNEIRYLVQRPFLPVDHLQTPLTPLMTMGDSPMQRGETWQVMYVGALPLRPQEQWISFGDMIQLRGYEIQPATVCPGENVEMRLLWGALRPPDRYYSFFLHLWSEATGELSAPINGQQPIGENRPTLSWTTQDELLIAPSQQWSVTDDVSPGTYALWLGMFEPISGERLYLPDGNHYHALGTLEVEPCAAS